MRRVGLNPDYSTGKVTIKGNDSRLRLVPVENFPLQANLPTVELEEGEATTFIATLDMNCTIRKCGHFIIHHAAYILVSRRILQTFD